MNTTLPYKVRVLISRSPKTQCQHLLRFLKTLPPEKKYDYGDITGCLKVQFGESLIGKRKDVTVTCGLSLRFRDALTKDICGTALDGLNYPEDIESALSENVTVGAAVQELEKALTSHSK